MAKKKKRLVEVPKPKITPEQLNLVTAPIQDIYSKLTEQIFANFVKHMTRVDSVDLTQDTAFAWRIEKLAKLNLLNGENIKAVSKATGIARKRLEQAVYKLGYATYKDADNQLQYTSDKTVAMAKDLDFTLGSMVSVQWLNIDNFVSETLLTTNLAGNEALKVYRNIVEEASLGVATGVMDKRQAYAQTVNKWIGKGILSTFVDKGGHQWTMEDYAMLVIDNTVHNTYEEMRMKRMREYGVVTAYIDVHVASRPAEADIQGHVVLMVPKNDAPIEYQNLESIYDHGYGTAGGARGINCTHMYTPFVPGVNRMPDLPEHLQDITPEKAVENGRKQATQRQLERQVRGAKTRYKSAELLGDENRMQSAKLSMKNNQSKLRKLVSDNDFLHRNYKREKSFKNTKLFEEQANILTLADKQEFKRYQNNLGKYAPKIFDDFKKIMYSDKWERNEFYPHASALVNAEISELVTLKDWIKIKNKTDKKLIGFTTPQNHVVRSTSGHFIARVIGEHNQRRTGMPANVVRDILLNGKYTKPNDKGVAKYETKKGYVTIAVATGNLVNALYKSGK